MTLKRHMPIKEKKWLCAPLYRKLSGFDDWKNWLIKKQRTLWKDVQFFSENLSLPLVSFLALKFGACASNQQYSPSNHANILKKILANGQWPCIFHNKIISPAIIWIPKYRFFDFNFPFHPRLCVSSTYQLNFRRATQICGGPKKRGCLKCLNEAVSIGYQPIRRKDLWRYLSFV